MKNGEMLFEALGETDPSLLFPPDEAESRERAGNGGERKKHRTAFAAAILAAAFLLIVGVSASGAQEIFARMRLITGEEAGAESGEDDMLFRMKIEEWNGCLTLSDEVMEALEALPEPEKGRNTAADRIREGSVISFDSWTDAAKWLDCGLLVSPLAESGRLFIQYLGGPDDSELRCVNVMAENFDSSSASSWIMINAKIPLNDKAWEIYNGGMSAGGFPGYRVEDAVVFEHPLGGEVTMVSTYGGQWTVIANFIHGGIIYQVTAEGPARGEAEGLVMKIVNSMGE